MRVSDSKSNDDTDETADSPRPARQQPGSDPVTDPYISRVSYFSFSPARHRPPLFSEESSIRRSTFPRERWLASHTPSLFFLSAQSSQDGSPSLSLVRLTPFGVPPIVPVLRPRGADSVSETFWRGGIHSSAPAAATTLVSTPGRAASCPSTYASPLMALVVSGASSASQHVVRASSSISVFA